MARAAGSSIQGSAQQFGQLRPASLVGILFRVEAGDVNPDQADVDKNGLGNACDPLTTYLLGSKDRCSATPGAPAPDLPWPLLLLAFTAVLRARSSRR